MTILSIHTVGGVEVRFDREAVLAAVIDQGRALCFALALQADKKTSHLCSEYWFKIMYSGLYTEVCSSHVSKIR